MFLDKPKSFLKKYLLRLRNYFRRLFFPIYLFPIKLVTYSFYYLIKFLLKLIWAILGLIWDCVIFPFRSIKNFLKAIIYLIIILYLFASLFVIGDYLTKQYGWWGKFFCTYGAKEKLQKSVVRIVGGYSEGSGFFITDNQVLTNFHVIANEPSPKVIFPDGTFVTPEKILGDKNMDLAVLFLKEKYPDFVFKLPDRVALDSDEPVLATGYPWGTDLVGNVTTVKGNFIDYRSSKKDPTRYIQTNINLVKGMSGGPLTDQCGEVVGVNTLGMSGISLFILADQAKLKIPEFTDQEVKKLDVDPVKSPEDAVRAYYSYLKARRMKDGFNLLSHEYLQKSNFEEWNNRFTDIIDVDIIKVKKVEDSDDTVEIKFSTKNWNDGEVDIHNYGGIWTMILEDGVYKIKSGKIMEFENPGWEWFYE